MNMKHLLPVTLKASQYGLKRKTKSFRKLDSLKMVGEEEQCGFLPHGEQQQLCELMKGFYEKWMEQEPVPIGGPL